MTITLAMSTGEIRRVGVWALRAVGYRFGTAERGARLLAWAEATGGGALRLLRQTAGRIEASAGVTTRRTRAASNAWIIDAQGKCLLEVGPPAVDLATCVAEPSGIGGVLVQNVFGVCMLGALCGLAVDRGLDVLAIFNADDSGGEPLPLDQCGWLSATRSVFRAGPLTPDRAAATRQLAEPLAAHLAGMAAPSAPAPGCLAIFVARHDAATALPDLGAPVFEDAGRVQALDYADQIRRANAGGIAVPFADFLNLYALERRCWAPTSEKSSSQAGF